MTLTMNEFTCELVSENNLLVRFADSISEELLDTIQKAQRCARTHFGPAFLDSISSYTTLLIKFDPVLISPIQAQQLFSQSWQQQAPLTSPPQGQQPSPSNIIEIPVCYAPEVALDIEEIADQLHTRWQEVARLHYQHQYRVYAMGFSPGFAFMGQLPPRLQTNRRSEPRTSVPSGSVAISDRQTAIYPQASPAGWNIIGRTPIQVFNPDITPANLFHVTDTIKFTPISQSEFIDLGGCL